MPTPTAVSTPTSLLNVSATPAPSLNLTTPTATATPTPASTTVTPPPKTPSVTPAPAPVPTYSFLDGSKYSATGQQISPPTIVTAKPAVTDLNNKQAALTQATTAQAQQAQNIATQNATSQTTPPAPAQPAPAATADDLNSIINGTNASATQANNALQDVQNQADATFASFQSQLGSILNGSFPLTPSQQASVNATQTQFDQLEAQQKLINQNLAGSTALAGAESGINQTSPAVNLSNISNVLSNGVSQIAAIDAQAVQAVSNLQQGFMNQDYTMINDAYTQASNLFAQKTQTINDMQKNITDATTQALAEQKQQADEQQQQLQNQQAAIQFAATNGITQPYYLVGNTAIDSATGLPVTLAQYQAATGQQVGLPENQTDFSKIQPIASPQVTSLMNAYPDAGINPTDTAQQAIAKLGNSAIYRKSTYIAPSSSAANLTPQDLEGLASTLGTYNGQAYLTPTDLTGYTPAQKGEITTAFKDAGTPTLSAKDADAIDSIQAAQQDIIDLQTALNTSTIQPKGFLGRPIAIANATLGSLFQVNNSPALDTFNLAAVPLLTALKGAGSGGGGGAARLFNTVTQYLPQKTDTVSIANQKITNLQKLLDNGATSILGSYSSSNPGQAIPKGTDGATYGYPGYVSDGTQWVKQ